MPGSQWLAPAFWLGAALGFLGSAGLLTLLDAVPKWAFLALPYFVGCFVGLRLVGLILRRFPDARYLTSDKIDGMGYVWDFSDVVMPYLILGVLTALFAVAGHWLGAGR